MRGGLLHEEARELQQEDANRVARAERVVRVDDAVDEHRHHVLVEILIRGGGPPDQPLPFPTLEGRRERGDQHVLEDLGLKVLEWEFGI